MGKGGPARAGYRERHAQRHRQLHSESPPAVQAESEDVMSHMLSLNARCSGEPHATLLRLYRPNESPRYARVHVADERQTIYPEAKQTLGGSSICPAFLLPLCNSHPSPGRGFSKGCWAGGMNECMREAGMNAEGEPIRELGRESLAQGPVRQKQESMSSVLHWVCGGRR